MINESRNKIKDFMTVEQVMKDSMYSFELYMDESYKNVTDIDIWNVAHAWYGDKLGVEYNFCKDCGEDASAIYKMEYNPRLDAMETYTDDWNHYEINFEDPDWKEKLEHNMTDALIRFFYITDIITQDNIVVTNAIRKDIVVNYIEWDPDELKYLKDNREDWEDAVVKDYNESDGFYKHYYYCKINGLDCYDADSYAHLNTLIGYDIGLENFRALDNAMYIDDIRILELDHKDKKLIKKYIKKLDLNISLRKWIKEMFHLYEFFH